MLCEHHVVKTVSFPLVFGGGSDGDEDDAVNGDSEIEMKLMGFQFIPLLRSPMVH